MDHYPYHRLASDIDTGTPRAITAVVEERRLRPFPAVDFVLSVQGGLPDSLGINTVLWRTGLYSPRDSLQRLPYLPGDTITVIGRIRWPRGQRNPHGFNELAYLWSRGIDARVVGLAQVPHWRPYTGLSLNRTVDAMRSRISGQLEGWMGDLSPLASALILGDRGNLDAAFVARTRAIGVAHILAVSGLHVGFIAVLLVALLRPWPISRLLKAGLAVLLLMGYLLLTGSPPSVMRAVIMVSLYLLGRASDRSVSTWNILSAAAILSLMIHPRSLLTPGFQLSFTAVAGIVAFHPYLKEALAASRWGSAIVANSAGRYIAGLMMMTIGAQLGSLPVTLAWFHQLPLMGVVANLIIVPLAGFGITALFIALLSSMISPLIAGIFGSAAWALFTIMTRAIDILARGPVPLLVTGAISWGSAIIIVVGVIFLPWLIWGRWRTRRFRLAAAILLAINLNLWPNVFAAKRLTVTILDVGQGDAIHIATPDGTHILVDAGPRYEEWDAGQMIVLPYLLGQGVTRLDLIAISHAHADHAGGLLSLLEL